MQQFTEEELNIILAEGMRLVLGRYVSGINVIQSPTPLPTPTVFLHYLQDSNLRITAAEQALAKNNVHSVRLPRKTFYRFEAKYAQKPNFLQEYEKANFINDKLEHAKAPHVKTNPNGWCVQADELNLMITLDNTDISRIVSLVYQLELSGKERWMDPAFILKGDVQFPVIPGFLRADYASIARPCAEVYSIIDTPDRKSRVVRRIEAICEELQTKAQVALQKESVLYHSGQINPELSEFIKRNLEE